MDRAGGVGFPAPVPVVSGSTGGTSVQVAHAASLIKLFWEALLSVKYRSRWETTGEHPG